jgi:hypothetical protein
MLVANELGWNLVSVPLTRVNNNYLTVYPGGIAGTFWQYAGAYENPSPADFLPGRGYWLKFTSAGTTMMTGDPLASVNISLVQGWNIIGSIDHAITAPSGGTITSSVFGFSNGGGYTPAASLQPGRGYWVKSSAAAVISVGPSAARSAAAVDLAKAFELRITDNRGRSQALYVVEDPGRSVDASRYELPPAQVDGFTARFASNRFLETAAGNGDFPVRIEAAAYPVTVAWRRAPASSAAVHLAAGARTIALDAPAGSAVIDGPVPDLRVLYETAATLPASYALEQNYPNPFNPSTVIRYQLPEAARVVMKLYNVVGQEMATLVDEQQEAGFRSIAFDARDLPSGIYFYRLRAGSFTDARKMLLVK